MKHVVDLDITVACTDPHDDGAGTVADAPGGPEVRDHLRKESRYSVARRCAKSLSGHDRSIDSDVGASRERAWRARVNPRRWPLRPRRTRALAKKTREKAFAGGRELRMKKTVR